MCVIRLNFINEKFAKIIYQILKIESQHLTKPKPIQKFDSKAV